VEAERCSDYRERRGDTGAESDVYGCLVIIRFKTMVTNTLKTRHYAYVAYVFLPYNMASATLTTESNSK